jgi:hypothetical protein
MYCAARTVEDSFALDAISLGVAGTTIGTKVLPTKRLQAFKHKKTKSVVMIGDAEVRIRRLIREHRCGTIITPGDAATLADTLRHWSEQPNSIAEMGAQARQMLDARFTRRQAFDQWRRLIGQLACCSPSADSPTDG